MNQPFGKSIWGNINTCTAVSRNMYYIYAEYGEGIIVPSDKATAIISEKAIAQAVEDGDFLYFDENTKDIPIYEALQNRIKICDEVKQSTSSLIREFESDGMLLLSDYFGECPPPSNQTQKIRNGIYFIQENENNKFAVHKFVAENFLTPFAIEFAEINGDYLIYEFTTSSIPIYELQNVYVEVKSMVMSEASLYATLHQQFPAYLAMYHSIVPSTEQLEETDTAIAFPQFLLSLKSNRKNTHIKD